MSSDPIHRFGRGTQHKLKTRRSATVPLHLRSLLLVLESTSANTGSIYGQTPSISVGGQTTVAPSSAGASAQKLIDDIERAVYGHIRALRALGRTTVNTVEVARSLGITASDVEAALIALKSKGVKIAA